MQNIRQFKFWLDFLKKYNVFAIIFIILFIPLTTLAEPLGDEIAVQTNAVARENQPNLAPAKLEEAAIPPSAPIENSVASHVVIQLKYIKAEQAKAMFLNLMANSQLKIETINNKLIVMGSPDDLKTVNAIIADIDKPARQVMFEAEIVEMSLVNLKNLGIDLGASTALPEAPGYVIGNAWRIPIGNTDYGINIRSTVNHLIQNKKGRLLANPRIAVLDENTAQIMIGDKLAVESRQKDSTGYTYITVNYIDVGIKLEVTPSVNEDGTITTKIKPEVSNKTDSTSNGNPNIRSRQAETTLRVKNGETIVLGGLIQREESKDQLKFPLIGDLPIVGHFFRSTTKEKRDTELVILITPRILV